jgi:ribosome-binding factor A
MPSQERLNTLLKAEVAKIISQEVIIPDVLLTVLKISSDDRASFLKIILSVLPSNKAGTALSALRKNSKNIAKKLQTKARLKRIPKLDWDLNLYDSSDFELDEIFKQIEKEKNE